MTVTGYAATEASNEICNSRSRSGSCRRQDPNDQLRPYSTIYTTADGADYQSTT